MSKSEKSAVGNTMMQQYQHRDQEHQWSDLPGLICPDCTAAIAASQSGHCLACGWTATLREGVPLLLSSHDQEDMMFRKYLENYQTIAEDDLIESIQPERYVEIQAEKFASYLPAIRDQVICDLGAGKGYLSRKLLAAGAKQVVAADIAIPYLAQLAGELRLTPVVANAENLPFSRAFDLIVATDILEHVMNVPSFLFAANRALKADGCLAVRVPYRENLMCYTPFFGCKYEFVHLRNYNRDILTHTLECAGFGVVRIEYDGFWPSQPQPWWTKGYILRKIYDRMIERLTRRGAAAEEINKSISNLWARCLMVPTSLTAIARKKYSLERPSIQNTLQ